MERTGKTALVTGASVGIGRDLAFLFARDGHDLVLTARNEGRLQELAGTLREQFKVDVEVIAKDLSVPAAPQEIFDALKEKFIRVDYLVNNAGFGTHGQFVQSDLKEQLSMLQVNIVSLTHLTRLFLPLMLERGSSRIMNVASVAAFFPGPLMAAYYASKAYVLSFSEALDHEVRRKGVSVTALCPGPTITEFQKRAGIAESRLFSMGVMTSAAVAEIGYRGMMRGKRLVVTGAGNKLVTFASRLAPRTFMASMTKKLNQNR
jgi:uncharacterized protein